MTTLTPEEQRAHRRRLQAMVRDSLKNRISKEELAARVKYPKVLSEFPTMHLLQGGKSIARIGDGELKIMCGEAQMREPASKRMRDELRALALSPRKDLVVAVPTMDEKGPKYLNWIRHRDRFSKVLNPTMVYGSAFISRPDSAPWIRCHDYAEHFERLWQGKSVALVSEDGTAIHRLVQRKARRLELIVCPHRETYTQIDAIEAAVNAFDPEIALLSCGPAATALAARLTAHRQTLDVGSAGGFLIRLLYGREAGEDNDDRSDK